MAPGQRTVTNGGRPGANGKDAELQITNVSSPGSQAGVRKRQPKRAERPHSKFSRRKALNGPAMRPETPPAPENGVGKLAAKARRMSAWERERGELPSPNLSPLDRKVRRGLFGFGKRARRISWLRFSSDTNERYSNAALREQWGLYPLASGGAALPKANR